MPRALGVRTVDGRSGDKNRWVISWPDRMRNRGRARKLAAGAKFAAHTTDRALVAGMALDDGGRSFEAASGRIMQPSNLNGPRGRTRESYVQIPASRAPVGQGVASCVEAGCSQLGERSAGSRSAS